MTRYGIPHAVSLESPTCRCILFFLDRYIAPCAASEALVMHNMLTTCMSRCLKRMQEMRRVLSRRQAIDSLCLPLVVLVAVSGMVDNRASSAEERDLTPRLLC